MDSLIANGKTNSFAITVIAVAPNRFVLLDGVHRLCAWNIVCNCNGVSAKQREIPATVLHSTLSFFQAEIVCAALNKLPQKSNELIDIVPVIFA